MDMWWCMVVKGVLDVVMMVFVFFKVLEFIFLCFVE